jgi:HSP20 family molecular chaperone IbpA
MAGQDDERPGGTGPKAREALDEIEQRMGGLFGALSSALGEILARATEAGEQAGTGKEPGERGFDTGPGPVRASGHVRIRTGLGDAATSPGRDPAQPVNRGRPADPGRADPAPASAPPPAVRAAPAEAFRDGPDWVLVAEMPGAAAGSVTVTLEGARIRIAAAGPPAWSAEAALPPGADPAGQRLTVENGIVTLRLPCADPA